MSKIDLIERDEPYVVVKTSAADTGDQGLSRFDGLICAAPIRNVPLGGNEPMMFGSGEYKRFLEYYTGEQTITSEMDSTVHHIYQLLGSVSVLVLKCVDKGSIGAIGSSLPSSNYDKYGNGVFISYTGYIALSDTDKSFLVDLHKNKITKKFTAVFEKMSITSATWINVYDRIHDNGGQVMTFQYDSSDKLKVVVGYSPSTVTSPEAIVQGISNVGIEDRGDISNPEDDTWNFAVIRTNPIGQAISNDYYAKLGLTITANTDKSPVREVTVKVYGEDESNPDENKLIINGTNLEIEGDILTHNFILSPQCNASNIAVNSPTILRESRDQITVSSQPKVQVTDITPVRMAFESLNDYDGGYRIDFLFDCGISDPSLHTSMAQVGENIKALAVTSLPGNDVKSLYGTVMQGGYSKGWLYRIAPYRQQNFGGYTLPMSLGIQYIEAIARNKSNLIEFAPVFNFVNGYVPDSLLTRDYNKTERRQLLGAGINTVKRDRFRGISFINNNVTADKSNSLFNEEQIVRMANRYAWDIDYIMEQFLGQIDDRVTANDIKTTIEQYHYTTMSGKKYSPERLEVICDESNNTFGNGEMNVIVNIYVGRALKKITVYNKFLPLSSL